MPFSRLIRRVIILFYRDAFLCLSVEQIEQSAFVKIAFALEPFRPAVLSMMQMKQWQMGEQGGYLLTGGTPQIEIEADGLVNCLTDVLGELIKLRAFEFLLKKIETDFSPGNQQEGQ